MERVAPRLPSDDPGSAGLSDARLPDDLVAEQVRRLQVFALVCGGLWGIGLLMDAVVYPAVVAGTTTTPPGAIVVEASAVALSLALYAWVRLSHRAAQAKVDAGLWLMLLNAAGIAMLETWTREPTRLMLGHLSWTAIVILLTAMIVPMPPRKMLAGSLVAASLAPIGVWFGHLRGVDTPSPLETLLMYMPTYSCAVAAVIPARVFQRMGRSLKQARDLGSYQLEALLGQGGMGEVWRARHRLLARPAAIKLMRPERLGAASGRTALRRFESEAQATAALTSPHTVRLFDFGATDDGRFYYVMELLDGRDLDSLVADFGAIPPARTLFLLRQVCHSLTEAHSRGLVHRDIKPANVMVCRLGLDADVVKVLDFGLVQHTERDPASDVTQSMEAALQVAGTPAFMAPEVVVGHAVDHRADIYAFGCLASFMLTGQPVFTGSTPMQCLIDHVSTPPAPPSLRSRHPVPVWLDALVLACLAKEPAQRPGSCDEVLRVIEANDSGPRWTSDAAVAWWQQHVPAPPVAAPHQPTAETRA